MKIKMNVEYRRNETDKTEIPGKKSFHITLGPPQIPHGLARERSWVSASRSQTSHTSDGKQHFHIGNCKHGNDAKL
jgi:hypothetical protein